MTGWPWPRITEQEFRERLDQIWGDDDGDIGVIFAWCRTENDLLDCRRQAHDALIDLMGDKRTGPVAWHWWTGQDAVDALDRAKQGATPAMVDHYRRIGAHLREWGGYVVMAYAKGKP